MRRFRPTKAASADLRGIGRYTRKKWGREQERRYLRELNVCFQRLAEKPDCGRPYPQLPPYWRIRQNMHMVYYRLTEHDLLLVVRVLHVHMLPELHLSGSEDKDTN
ncbi:MAG: type II toxin-antitoxin system RelE/ParE family toxin [Alphaproteobacteria bacterium]